MDSMPFSGQAQDSPAPEQLSQEVSPCKPSLVQPEPCSPTPHLPCAAPSPAQHHLQQALSVKNTTRVYFLQFKPLLPATYLLLHFISSPHSTKSLRTRFPGWLLYIQTTSFPSCSSREGHNRQESSKHHHTPEHIITVFDFPGICFPVVPQIPQAAAMSPAPLSGLPVLLPGKPQPFLRHRRMISSSDSGYPGMRNILKGKSKSDEFFFFKFGPHSISTPGTYINHVNLIPFNLVSKSKQE